MGGDLAVQGGVPERSRIDGVDSLAQVEMEVLGRSTSTPVEGTEATAPAMSGIPIHVLSLCVADTIGSRPANETEAPVSVIESPDVGQQVVESLPDGKVIRSGGVTCRRHCWLLSTTFDARTRRQREPPFPATADSTGIEKCQSRADTARGPRWELMTAPAALFVSA